MKFARHVLHKIARKEELYKALKNDFENDGIIINRKTIFGFGTQTGKTKKSVVRKVFSDRYSRIAMVKPNGGSKMHLELDDDLQKLIQAGIGALAIGAEKSEALLKMFVKKGESILRPPAIRNEELKHRRKEEPKKTIKILLNLFQNKTARRNRNH